MRLGEPGKGVEQREHHTGHRKPDTEFHQNDAVMLALGGVVGEHVVV